ncbi:phage major capsid protein [Candidatus Symbiopectobacterium endolongispinus]|uniref:phage major capsid protein n=1 Tax=Candidatus Symbiopectobacterium endolongispinus TaxID=2812664 RepID=UPI002079AC43|nr:phage major capsid protein [Candidatus Symbiopectobacterium endolongispinus]MBT9428890.1 phage major capsid protein [Candidatus Symbiopectobacterium endolongispinus]
MSDVNEMFKKVTASIEEASSKYSAQAEKALKEAQKSGELSAETKAAVDKMAVELNALREAEKTLKSQVGEVEQHIAQMPVANALNVVSSIGQQVVGMEVVQALGSGMESSKRIVAPINAALISSDVAGTIVAHDRQADILTKPPQRLFIRDLIASGKTQSNTIYYVKQKGFTNNAKTVAENTAKPYSTIEFEEAAVPVRTITHMFKASKQILDDFSQLASIIDMELRYGLKYVEEQQILFGDGTGSNLNGIFTQATAFKAELKPAHRTAIDNLRLAMLQAQLARIPATGHVLHFTNWAQIELIKDTLGRYLLSNPAALTTLTLWGLPVVVTEAAEFKDKFLVGAFNLGAQLFDREEANVVISTENTDDFEKNMISIRCEERLALAVYRPEAFIKGDLTKIEVSPSTPSNAGGAGKSGQSGNNGG